MAGQVGASAPKLVVTRSESSPDLSDCSTVVENAEIGGTDGEGAQPADEGVQMGENLTVGGGSVGENGRSEGVKIPQFQSYADPQMAPIYSENSEYSEIELKAFISLDSEELRRKSEFDLVTMLQKENSTPAGNYADFLQKEGGNSNVDL